MMDAFQEVYHIRSLHKRTIAPFFLDMKTAGEAAGVHTRILVGRDKLERRSSCRRRPGTCAVMPR